MPIICMAQMDEYICIHAKGILDNHDADRDKKDSSILLISIQPTEEQHKQDNQDEVEHAISTIIPFVKDKYKLTELRVEYRALRCDWDKGSIGWHFPKQGVAENGLEYYITNYRAMLVAHGK